MWGLTMLSVLGSLWLTAGSGQVAGPGDCHLYDLSVPEGSSRDVGVNITEQTIVVASSSAGDYIMVLNNRTLRYYNSTFKDRITVSEQHFTVHNASEWMAGEYKVFTYLSEICLAHINLTVTAGPVSSPSPTAETPPAREGPANQTGEGSSRGTVSSGSPEEEPRGRYGLWAVLGFVALFTAAALYVCWKRRREGPGTRCGCEEEGISDSAGSPVCASACVSLLHEAGTQDGEAGEIPRNGEVVQPWDQS